MATRSVPERYGALSIGLHWLMLALLVAVYACMELRGIFPRGSDAYQAMKTWHFMLGLSVFALVSVRIVLRLAGRTPPIVPTPAPWQHRVAALVHLAIYAFMIVMPLLGWLALSADGKPVPFFGMALPPLVGPDEALAHQLEDIHETIGTIGYWLIGLHAAAALFHHYVVRDNTLLRMLPRWGRA
jgi:cytochrome b561